MKIFLSKWKCKHLLESVTRKGFMNSTEYLNALKSSNINDRREALKTGYVPKNMKEVDATVEGVMLGGNSNLQREAFNLLVDHVPIEIAMSGFISLALKSHQEEIRLDALNKIQDDNSEKVTNALLIAACDGEIDVQKAAIRALEGRESPETTSLLLSRIEEPDGELFDTYENRSDEIKRVAINSLGVKNQNDQIPKLVEIALNDLDFRPEVKTSLERIGTTEVAESLLSIVEGTYILDDEQEPPGVDRQTDLFIANIIPSLKTKTAQVDRFRLCLCNLYREEILKGPTELSKYMESYFNEEIGKCLSDVIALHTAQHDVIDRVIIDLANVSISLSFPYWLNILDNPEDQVCQQAVQKMTEVLSEDLSDFPKLLSASLTSGERPAHERNRLVQIVINISSGNTKPFSDVLVPLVRDSESSSSMLAIRYLEAIWEQISIEEREIMLDSVITKGYIKRKDGQGSLGKFINKTWDSGTEESRERIYRKLVDKRFKSTSMNSVTALDNLLCYLADNVSSPGTFAQLIISDLEKTPRNNKRWEPLGNILGSSPAEESGKLLIESLYREWNKSLLKLAISLKVPGIESFCRTVLSDTEYELPEKDEAWVIEILGGYENDIDSALFANYITSENPVSLQVEAIRSLSKLQFSKAIEASLVRSLKIPLDPVVEEAVGALGNSAFPTVTVVSALQERANPSEEDNASIIRFAQQALGKLTERHLHDAVEKEADDNIFEEWLEVLRQIGVCECQEILIGLLSKHSDPEYEGRRISIVKTISSSTKPENGIKILEEYVVKERVASVKDAMRAALDELEGHPDRADFNLLEKVIGQNIDRKDLLGSWHLNDVFSQQRTIIAFREGLRRALNISKENNALVEQLDAISDALIRDLFVADGQKLDPDGRIPEDAHESRIGKLKSHYPEIALAADAIHELRKLKVKGPHSFDPSGAVRSGVDDSDRNHAIDSFSLLCKEIIKTLRNVKDSQSI